MAALPLSHRILRGPEDAEHEKHDCGAHTQDTGDRNGMLPRYSLLSHTKVTVTAVMNAAGIAAMYAFLPS